MRVTEHIPATASNILQFRGDLLTFQIKLDSPISNEKAFLRTNIGHAGRKRLEIIAKVEKNNPIGATDWFDIPMHKDSENSFSIAIPMLETGHFEAKAYVMRPDQTILWPNGDNIKIKVEPAHTCAANNVYTAFVRQFRETDQHLAQKKFDEISKEMESSGFSVIPPAGTFRNLQRRLSTIIDDLGFSIIQLLPIHPVPTTFAKMGTFGSPFAALDYFNVDPSYAEFDKKHTPLEQFIELIDAIHAKGARIFMDIPINHTGWASRLQIEHPEWFKRDNNNNFSSPGAWGITWEDLSELDFSHTQAWEYMASVFRFWCSKGVDGFRCDAGYMIPGEAWNYIIAKVRRSFPDTVFLLENLGGKKKVMQHLLAECGMNWAYSEIFQQYNRNELEYNIPIDREISRTKGIIINYAETHDNNRLASVSKEYSKLRVALAALVSSNGAYGITNGVEWFADCKVDVHGASPLNWNASINQIDHIAKLNTIIRTNSTFFDLAEIKIMPHEGANSLAVFRKNNHTGDKLLCLFNLDAANSCQISCQADFTEEKLFDMLSKKTAELENGLVRAELKPYEVLCLTPDPAKADIQPQSGPYCIETDRQVFKAVAMETFEYLHGSMELGLKTPDELADALKLNPYEYCIACKYGFNKDTSELFPPPIETIKWPVDRYRIPVIPWGNYAYITCENRFSMNVCSAERDDLMFNSLQQADGKWFVLIPNPDLSKEYGKDVKITVVEYGPEITRTSGTIYFAERGHTIDIQTIYSRKEVIQKNCSALCTNRRGAMAMVRGAWGSLHSIYDAMLAANMHKEVPVDRHIMLTRCRMWAIYHDYSTEINIDCLKNFYKDPDNNVFWDFEVPIGMGKHVNLTISFGMVNHINGIFLYVKRNHIARDNNELNPDEKIHIVIRPDVEDRINHEVTKASRGPEQSWPNAVHGFNNGFTFQPNNQYQLKMSSPDASFFCQHEWLYMVHRPFEATRGLEADSDLFSPGYFKADLPSDKTVRFTAAVMTNDEKDFEQEILKAGNAVTKPEIDRFTDLERFIDSMILDFVVKRDDCQTVIAGYPWFLDWGRDTLICLRGMLARGMIEQCKSILVQFARFEQNGTLPNMIRGNDDSNRDTSDAPLWYCVTCADLIKKEHNSQFLKTDNGNGRTIAETVISIAEGYINGTKNGIKMDSESGLVFSPSHFTWMDTNYPAGTPRTGYPIEIQALWYATLKFAAEISGNSKYQELSRKVKQSIARYYTINNEYLADCLNAEPGQKPGDSQVDDALRPNQLLAITLGAIDDRKLSADILKACSELVVPGSIRSLSKRTVKTPLSIYHNGMLLNDPHNPYWGHYQGDEDTSRKPAYHNGTCWGWVFPLYPEAMYITYGEHAKETARSILSSVEVKLNTDCICQLTEVADGDAPHTVRGCPAQAWSVTELARVMELLK